MAHYTQQQFVRWTKEFFPEYFNRKRVLEIGSLDINGSVRSSFTDCDYIGLDVGEGPGVDVVCGGQEYDAPDASFDVVCSFEAMEHNPFWKETFSNMLRLVKPGGLILMTCATNGRPEHGTSRSKPDDSPLTANIGWDHYRNLSANDFRSQFAMQSLFTQHMFAHYYYSCDLLFFGFRSGGTAPNTTSQAIRKMQQRYAIRNVLQWPAFPKMVSVKLGFAK